MISFREGVKNTNADMSTNIGPPPEKNGVKKGVLNQDPDPSTDPDPCTDPSICRNMSLL